MQHEAENMNENTAVSGRTCNTPCFSTTYSRRNWDNSKPEDDLKIEITYRNRYPLAFYNAFCTQGEPDITVNVYNPTDTPITVKVTSEYQGISYSAIITKTVMPRGEMPINQTIQLKTNEIEKIDTKTLVNMHCKIEYEEERALKVWETTEQVDIYPEDTMVWAWTDNQGNHINNLDYIAVFVTPKADEIQELLATTKEYHPERTLAGYQFSGSDSEGWREYTALQVKSIYNALKEAYGVSYVNTPTAFGKDVVQKVRLPKDSLRLGSANCIDGTVLFASAIEALKMKPYIAIVPGHAFLAWDTSPSGEMRDALETTMVGNADFKDAWQKGVNELNQYWDALTDDAPWNGYFVDIKACRRAGILPIEWI